MMLFQQNRVKKKDTTAEKSIFLRIYKQEILNYVHKQRLYTLKKLMHDYNIPAEVKQQWEALMVPINELTPEQNSEYAKQVSSIYSIFQKYVEQKKTFSKKEETEQEQSIPLAQVKVMISSGKSLGDVRIDATRIENYYDLAIYYKDDSYRLLGHVKVKQGNQKNIKCIIFVI